MLTPAGDVREDLVQLKVTSYFEPVTTPPFDKHPACDVCGQQKYAVRYSGLLPDVVVENGAPVSQSRYSFGQGLEARAGHRVDDPGL